MAYEIIESLNNERERTSRLELGTQPTFANIFDGVSQFYPGSVVQVQEELKIITNIFDPSLVDVDFTWFDPKQKLGTYQIFNLGGTVRGGAEDQGFLTSVVQSIYRYSTYTITANPNVLVAQHEQIALDNCNLILVPDAVLFPESPVPVAGVAPYRQNPVLIGSVTLSTAPLADTEFNQLIRGVGLYLNPGVEGLRLEYSALVINDIYTDYPSVTVPACRFIKATCDQEYAAFLVQGSSFETQQQCEAVRGTSCFPFTYNFCSSDSTYSKIYWQAP